MLPEKLTNRDRRKDDPGLIELVGDTTISIGKSKLILKVHRVYKKTSGDDFKHETHEVCKWANSLCKKRGIQINSN